MPGVDCRVRHCGRRFAHIEDQPHIDWTALVGKGGAARDDEAVGDTRQVGCYIVRDAVGEIFLLGIVRQVGEGQHDDDSGGSADGTGPVGRTGEI